VGARDFVIVDLTADSSRQCTGIRVTNFIKVLGQDAMCVVVYEAYKLLEEDLTILMQSILQMKANAKIVKHLRYILIFFYFFIFFETWTISIDRGNSTETRGQALGGNI